MNRILRSAVALTGFSPCFIIFCFATSTALAAEEKPSVSDLVRQLTSDDFDKRESATASLKQVGEESLEELQSAFSQTKDLELRSRLERLLKQWPVGGTAWESDTGVFFGLPVVVGKRLYVTNKDSNVYCMDTDSGRIVWSTPTGDLMFNSLAYSEGRIFVIRTRKLGRKDGRLFCLDAKDGQVLWDYKFEPDSQTFTAPMATGGKLYIACEENLFCITAATGKVEWRFSAPETLLSPSAVDDNKILIGCLDQKLYCVNAIDGKELWNFQTEGSVYAGAAISGRRAFVGSHDHNIYCLDMIDGKKQWEFNTPGCVAGAPAVAYGHVFAGCDSGLFFCLEAATGKEVWEYNTGGNVFTAAAISKGEVFVSSLSNKLTLNCLNADDGKPIWNFETKEGGYAMPVLAGRRLFVGYHSKLYSVRTGLKGPESWPLTNGNPARTGFND